MVALSWILSLLCVTGSHQATPSPSPDLRPLQVQPGQSVTLTCNLSVGVDITWWAVPSGSRQLQRLFTLVENKVGVALVEFYTSDSRMNASREAESVGAWLQVSEVREEDTGVYFCTGRCGDSACYDGHFLLVTGSDVTSLSGEHSRPCWTTGVCALPASVVFVFFVLFGLYLWTGKSCMCRCDSAKTRSTPRVTEDVSLHYSSLRHQHKPRPFSRGQGHMIADNVLYSTVNARKK